LFSDADVKVCVLQVQLIFNSFGHMQCCIPIYCLTQDTAVVILQFCNQFF